MNFAIRFLVFFFVIWGFMSVVWPRLRRRREVRNQEDKMILSVIYLHQVEIRKPTDRWKRRAATLKEIAERLPMHLGYGHPLTAESELLKRLAVLEKRGLVASRTVQHLFENPMMLYWVTSEGLEFKNS